MAIQYFPTQKPGILRKEVGEETILYSNEGKAIHVLNASAVLIWKLCDGEHTVKDIAAELGDKFSIPTDVDLEKDILLTLKLFEEKGLLMID